MDRNLGATSATPGDVGALGLLYQWGRKDPFLGSSDISSDKEIAASTKTFPKPVKSNRTRGTIKYATSHPMTLIIYSTWDSTDYDWFYSGSNENRWQSNKTIYDPCPAGWRVPDGKIWARAKGYSEKFQHYFNKTNRGMNFGSVFGPDSIIWYPNAGGIHEGGGWLDLDCFHIGDYWLATSCNDNKMAYILSFYDNGSVYPLSNSPRQTGASVRCLKE